MDENSHSRNLEGILSDLIGITNKCRTREDALQMLVDLCLESFQAKACTLIETNLNSHILRQVAYSGFDYEFKRYLAKFELKTSIPAKSISLDYKLISQEDIIEKYDLQNDGGGVINLEFARRYDINSALLIQLNHKSHRVYFLSIFSETNFKFSEESKKLLETFASQAEIIFEKFESTRNLKILEEINAATLEMVKANNIEKIYQQLLRTSIKITNAQYGLIRQLNYSKGELEVVATRGIKRTPPTLPFGKGIVWKALEEGQYQLVEDVKSPEWKDYYFENVPETRSELAVPLLVEKVSVRQGKKTTLQSRPLGVLNLESPEFSAFSQDDITALRPLVQQTALIIDVKETERKLKGLLDIDKSLVNKRDLNEVLQIVAAGIKDNLDFEWINISLVSQDGQSIKTSYVLGLDEYQAKEFKEMSVHALRSGDIQSEIIKTKKIEVVSEWDDRLDLKIYEKFKHEDLIRVFVPIFAPSTGEAIGTVEAGHKKDYRGFIDERDIYFLQVIVANAAEVIDPQARNLLARIRHELSSSIVGIRSNANFLQLMRDDVRKDIVDNKLSDILTDCDILLLNVEEIEYLLGLSSQEGKIKEVLFIRDIIFKTVNQLTPLIKERKFSTHNITYPRDEPRRIKIYVEKAKLNQVVTNLLTNAIKYSKKNPEDFNVEIEIEEDHRNFTIKFSDWGIGIKREHNESIFRLGFRSPEAIALDINGSGLGLTIARERIREIGGDLILFNNSNPTIFNLIIPKSLMEKPK